MPLFDGCVSQLFPSQKKKPGRVTICAGSLFAGALAVTLSAGAATASTGLGSAFDCGDVIGKVFDDKNKNGYQEQGEVGLPGVRLATARGLLSITDKHGRYHVACAQIPKEGIGSVFLLKLDERTLPAGYRITTENPRTVRLTPGKTTRLNFGVLGSRVVRLDLAGAAFEPNGTGLNAQWNAGIDQLITMLRQEPSVLRVIYQKGTEDTALVDKRMRAVSRLVEQRWQQRERGYQLEIEQRMMTGR